MARFHRDEPTCEYGAGLSPEPGDLVQICTAQAVWRVCQIEPDGRLTLDPTPGPGWTWFRPDTVTAAHVSAIVASPEPAPVAKSTPATGAAPIPVPAASQGEGSAAGTDPQQEVTR